MRKAGRRERSQWKAVRIGIVVLLASISGMVGCVPFAKKAGTSVVEMPVVLERTTVKRPGDGREGFVITESVPAGSGLRSDFNRAVRLIGEGGYDDAIALLEGLIIELPDVSAPHINVSLAYLKTNRPELAEEHLKAALAIIPGHPVASNQYGLLLRRAGRFDEARNVYEASIEQFPEYLPVRKNLGILCELYLADSSCAIEQYGFYSESNPEDEQVKLWIANLRLRSDINE